MHELRWVLLAVILVGASAIDLAAHRGERADSPRRAAAWIALGLAFCAWIAVTTGRADAERFLAAYLVEKSLSLDNMLVFFLIFQRLHVDVIDQRRVLFWGVAGALATRGAFIAVGAHAVERWHFVLYGFGALLVLLAVRTAFGREADNEAPHLVSWLERHLRVVSGVRRSFVVRIGGRSYITPLGVALVAVESSDAFFAIDSIPSAFAVTSSPFLLYSSNVLAVLGLRALFLVMTSFLARLRTLRWGLAAILFLAGIKLLVTRWIDVPPRAAVDAILACLGAMLIADRMLHRQTA